MSTCLWSAPRPFRMREVEKKALHCICMAGVCMVSMCAVATFVAVGGIVARLVDNSINTTEWIRLLFYNGVDWIKSRMPSTWLGMQTAQRSPPLRAAEEQRRTLQMITNPIRRVFAYWSGKKDEILHNKSMLVSSRTSWFGIMVVPSGALIYCKLLSHHFGERLEKWFIQC